MIIEITRTDLPELDAYFRLTEAQLQGKQNRGDSLFIAESPTVIEYALRSGYEPVSLLMLKKHIDGAGKNIISQCGDIPVYTANAELLSELTGFEVTRGILCAMRRKTLPNVHSILEISNKIAVLENITDPTNIGSIFRSAAALGMDAVLLSDSCCDPLYRRAARVSMGGVFSIKWAYIHDWYESGCDILHKAGYTTFALALRDNSINIDDHIISNTQKIALVLGSEGRGLRQSTIDACRYTVKIPMYNGMDSLNVATTASICFWQIGKADFNAECGMRNAELN